MASLVQSQMPWRRRLTCGQMAKANCVTEKTLRFYQKKGILEPEFVDEATGFRYYGIVQSTKLDMITHLQSMGFSLDEIKDINDTNDIGYLRDEAQLRLQHIREQRRDLEQAEKLAVDLIGDCDSYLNMPLCERPMLENLPGGLHVVYYIDTGYGDEGQAVDSERFALMETYARENGLEAAGDSFCEAISRFQRFFNTSLDSYSRYCMPVRGVRNRT